MKSTLLLRFRDLSCPRGETINRHSELIQSRGYVWWGWWNKGHEKLPSDTLTALKLKGEGKKPVYLFDSAQKKFYRATMDDYKAEVGCEIVTPSTDHTPTYYVENTHPVWFKFSQIDEVDSTEILGSKSYESMGDLFAEESHYEIYDNKIVASSDELAEQNRTIWRIRDKSESDKTNEIRLRGMTELKPRHFDKSYNTTAKDSLLWISDPHFTNGQFHRFALQDNNPGKRTLAQTIQSAYFSKEKNIASLLISGDFTWKGDREEFALASEFIDYLCSVNNLDKSLLSMCPGNHDLSFHVEEQNGDTTNEFIQKNYQKSRAAYGDFYLKYFDVKPNESMSSGRRLLLNNTIPVEIVLLNSVTLQQTKESFQGHGFIGQSQLEEVEKEMGFCKGKKPRNVTRICVMHHHLMPVSLTEDAYHDAKYSTVLDAERLARWLTEHKFDFLLHGHMHQNFHCTIERSQITHKMTSESNPTNKLNVLSLGSSGVCESHTGEAKGNWCCRIEFSNEKIIFHYDKISPEDATLADGYKLEFDYNV